MPLLHPTHNAVKSAQPRPRPQTCQSHGPIVTKPSPPNDTLVRFAPPVDLLQYPGTDVARRAPYLKNVVRCQVADRVCRKRSALAGSGVGGAIGLVWGIAAGPFCPVVGAAGALVGAALGAASPWKEAAPFGQVRKHLFFKSGIVESRADSATLVAALKKNDVLKKGRGRDILALQNLSAVLDGQLYLNPKQREKVQECLEFIAKESASFDALTQERARLQSAILLAQRSQRHLGGSAPDLQALFHRQALINERLLTHAPGAPRAMRQLALAPTGPQHMRVSSRA